MRGEGKVAIVTGAGSGIGEAIARKLAREGAPVVVADLPGSTAQDDLALGEHQHARPPALVANRVELAVQAAFGATDKSA